jgi:aldose 1-epimerase
VLRMSASPTLRPASVRRGHREGMETVTLTGTDLEATFVPSAGMICRSLRHGGEELLAQLEGLSAYAETGATMGIPLLHPWANRLGDWAYEALGQRVDLRRAGTVVADPETGLPMHGTLPGPWRLVSVDAGSGAARLVGEQRPFWDPAFRAAFPFDHRVRLVADVDGATLRLRTTVLPVRGPVPVAFGFHPYFDLPGVPRERYELELPVRRRLELDERKVPTGAIEPVEPFAGPLGERTFDDGYDRLATPALFAAEGGGRRVEVRFEAGYDLAQVFAPAGKEFVCFEPMTARTDALRTDAFPVATPATPYTATFSVSVRAA